MIGHENRALEGVEQRRVVDIGIGIMNEYTWLHIARCVDVQVVPSPCDTPAHKLAVILKIHAKNRLCFSEMTDAAVHFLPLPGIWQKL